MHPSEDWAETFAHYLHIRDTLQTAAAYRRDHGRRPSPARARREPGSRTALIARLAAADLALNALNRSMGLDDLYPFVLPPA